MLSCGPATTRYAPVPRPLVLQNRSPRVAQNPQTGQVVQGYYITAYRNLTTAMIEDLKADSARWDNERRAQTSRNTSGGIHASREATGLAARLSSNSPVVQYRYSETHQSRQHHGPTDNNYQDPYAREPAYDGPRYPGTGAPGYTGAAGSYPPPQQQQQPGYPQPGGPYGGFQQAQQSPPPPDARYASPAQAGSMYPTGQDSPYIATGANNHRAYASGGDPYAASRIGASAAAAQQSLYATAAPPQSGYPAPSFNAPYPGQVPQQPTSYAQPHDPFYGRGAYKKHT
jgi:hypothetical protein